MLFDISNDPVLTILTQGGPTALLALGLYGFFSGRLVSGSEARRREELMRSERDEYREIVYANAKIANRSTELAAARLELEKEYLDLVRRREGTDDAVATS